MKNLKNIEAISEYYDSAIETDLIKELLVSENYKNLYANFSFISKVLKYSYQALDQEIFTNKKFPSLVVKAIEKQDKQLKKILNYTYKDIKKKSEKLDLWGNIERKLDKLEQENKDKNFIKSNETYEITSFFEIQDKNLRQSFELPKDLKEEADSSDFWSKLEGKLDQQYHEELWSENIKQASAKEKYIIGLCEYIDNECSLEKSQQTTNHLLECSSCRNNYLNFVKLRKVLSYSFNQGSATAIKEDVLWLNIEKKLFNDKQRKKAA